MTVTITGVREVDRRLANIEKRDARRIGRNAARAGASQVSKGIKSAAPIGETKGLKRSIGWRHAKNRRKAIQETKAGINVGKKVTDKNRSKYGGHLVMPKGDRTRKRIGGKFAYLDGDVDPTTGKIGSPLRFVAEGWQRAKGAALSAMKTKVREGFARLRRGK